MSGTDQLTDTPELRELRDALSGIALPERPRVEAITTRGHARRRHRRAQVLRLSVAGATAAIAVSVGLIAALSPAARLGTIRTAAYTLRHNHNGTDTLTLNPGELFNASQLQSDLAMYGIPAKVTTGSYCTSDPAPAGSQTTPWANIVEPSSPTAGPGPGRETWKGSGKQPSLTIDPSQMPSGTELSVGVFQLSTGQFAGEQQADLNLIYTDSYNCTTTPPTLGPATAGIGALYGGPGPS
jgi:hypothetical protein